MRLLIIAASLLCAAGAFAAEPSGCDKFAWPLTEEQQLLGGAQKARAGSDLDREAKKAVEIALAPLADAGLPMAPERAPQKTPALAGYLRFGKSANVRLYKVT